MNLITGIIVLCGMFYMFASFVAGVYALLNKPQAAQDELLSAEQLEELMKAAQEEKEAVHTSNVLGIRMGFDSDTLISSINLNPQDCQTLCIGTSKCSGFQLYGSDGCDLLANVQTTYAFKEDNYNMFNIGTVSQQKAFGLPRIGEIAGRDLSFAPSPGPAVSSYTTKQDCAKACMSKSGCQSFSVSPTAGCKLKTSSSVQDVGVVPQGGTDVVSYFLDTVTHSSDWNFSKAAAPASSSA